MFHEETKQYREPDEIRAEYEKERLMAAAHIILAVIDYHKAKRLIADRKITFEKFFTLDDWEKQTVLIGKSAHEWLTRKPRAKGSGWTLEHCCELLGLRPHFIREEYVKPSVFREYKRLVAGLGGAKTIDKNQKHGEENANAKLTQAQAEQMRKDYAEGFWTHRTLAKKYGVGESNVGRVLRREAYA